MSLVEEMHGCGAGILVVHGGVVTGMSSETVDGDMEGSGLTRGVKVVRACTRVVDGLVQGYFAGAMRYRG